MAPEPAAGERRDTAGEGADVEDFSHIARLIAPARTYEDAEIASLRSRALAYLHAGVPVHFRGRAGMGKTTLALRLAQDLGRPIAFVSGDHALGGADLAGREVGQDTTRLHDRYIQSVTRTEQRTRAVWRDSVLTEAMIGGHTLIYDEFTRSSPETNNILLPVLEERVLVLPNPVRGRRYVEAHPEFSAIFTSNPDEYAGVKAAPDALFDRMITFDVSWREPATEAGIVACRTGIGLADAARIVRMLQALRRHIPGENPPSLRTAVMIGRVLQRLGVAADAREERFVQICLDVLETRAPCRRGDAERARYLADLRAQIIGACAAETAEKTE